MATTASVSTRVRLGRSGLEVSPICFGTWQLGGEWGPIDERKAIDAIRHARSIGINFFDTAQAYGFGRSERMLGHALAHDLRHHRDDVVIATKGGLRPDGEGGVTRDSSPEWLRSGVEQSLTELGIDCIDLYQVHWPDSGTPLAETAGALAELVDEGKIGHVGVSNFSAEQMEELSRTLPVETLQPPYHLFRRDIEESVLPWCQEHDVGVLAYGPLAHGLLSGKIREQPAFPKTDWRRESPLFQGEPLRRNLQVVQELADLAAGIGCTVPQLAIAWVLAHPAVEVAIVGTRRARHVDDACHALKIELGGRELERIARIMSSAVTAEGPSPEMNR